MHSQTLCAELTLIQEWSWNQLLSMKVGGNESAAKYYKANGGTAALQSKDPKTKYNCDVARRYKAEIENRVDKELKRSASTDEDIPSSADNNTTGA